MTRIYTNVPSMVALNNLGKNMSALETSLQRLSTGFKINTGADDPAGLIASELLRSDITGIRTAIKNTERANMMIATADSALNEVANLLNDIRGLVTEAANTGAMSASMIAANQLQVDASLDAIDRIASQTSFMGQKLLDGSLDFDMTGVNRNDVQNLAVHQVNFGADKSPVSVEVTVRQAAEKAALYYNNPALADAIVLQWGGNLGYSTQTFERGATVEDIAKAINATANSTGVIAEVGSDAIQGLLYTSSLGPGNDIILTAGSAGVIGGNIEVKYLPGNSDGIYIEFIEAAGPDSPAVLNVYLQMEQYKSSSAPLVDTSPGINDNNALSFVANILGDQYNNASINYVDGQLTQANWGDTTNPTGQPEALYAYYSDTATEAKALFGNINGLGTFAASLTSVNDYFTIQAKQAGAAYNDVNIVFALDSAVTPEIPAGKGALARYDEATNTLRIIVRDSSTLHPDGATSFQDIADALKLEGHFEFKASDDNLLTDTLDAADSVGTITGNTQKSGGDAGTLFIVMPPDSSVTKIVWDDATSTWISVSSITANDIVALFNMDSGASKGSERAASLFDVKRTADNDGTGAIELYAASSQTEFHNIFQDGVTGNTVVTTAAQLVTALNNSAFWGMSMCPELLAELAAYNASGQYFDTTNPPIILARLAPGNSGLFAVSPFEEVAYYGDPNDGTGLQFLGEKNSPCIRFVAEAGNDVLWVERTTVPDTVDFAQAVLSATNANASLVITANKKGEEYDDVQILLKRADETTLDRADGWVEYDPGKSFAESQVTFDVGGTLVPDTAFFITATERGDLYNNVQISMMKSDLQTEDVVVTFDQATNKLLISLNSSALGTIDANQVIAAINNAAIPFNATLSFAETGSNDGSGIFAGFLASPVKAGQAVTIGNTGDTGGHNGTITVWLEDSDLTANQVLNLINHDEVVGRMFNARNYTSGTSAGTGAIDFFKDSNLVSTGGLVERGVLTVHLVTDKNGLVQTTARDLVEWWDKQDPATVANISASIVRPPGAVWDECDDPYGWGLLKPTVELGECDEWIINDICFVGWNDFIEKQEYVAAYAKGTMTSDNGENASYDLIAKRAGPDYNGYTIVYVDDPSVTGYYVDNIVSGSGTNPCEYNPFYMPTDDCGNPILPTSRTNDGLYLEFDAKAKVITIHINATTTTAYDIEQLIESDPMTKNLFYVEQHGDGSGNVSLLDDTLLTKDGALPPGYLNGAKLLFGSEATDYFLIFKSAEYGSDQFVDIQATGLNGGSTTFKTYDTNGKAAEKVYGKDVDALINGVQAVGSGLGVNLNTSNLSMDFTLSESAGTSPGYSTNFTITGGGATYQIGPDVVSNQQITIGVQSVNTVKLGGVSGKLYQLRSGQDASLKNDTNKAYRIVQEAIEAIASTRGRLGTMQRATFDTNINVLNDTLVAITAAESQIRDTDFAEETSNLTRAQILVQSNLSTLGIANQIPNYMLSLIR